MSDASGNGRGARIAAVIGVAVVGMLAAAPFASADPTLTSTPVGPNVITPIAFGDQQVDVSSPGVTITLTNDAASTLPLTFTQAPTIDGSDNEHFSFGSNLCTAPLAPGASCTVDVYFEPLETGFLSADFNVYPNDPLWPTGATYLLEGTGVDRALTVSPAAHDFGSHPLGSVSSTQVFTATNTSTEAVSLLLTNSAITGSTFDATQFNIVGGTCDNGQTLTQGEDCTLSVAFAPTLAGARAATLEITSDAGGSPDTASLTGVGTAPPVVTPPVTRPPKVKCKKAKKLKKGKCVKKKKKRKKKR
jgi:hypothetical protein